jgi:hypothetical protein
LLYLVKEVRFFFDIYIERTYTLKMDELTSHSQTGEPRTGIVSRLETQQGTAATHILESQGQALSAGLKHSKAQQPLTSWRAKDRHCQQA